MKKVIACLVLVLLTLQLTTEASAQKVKVPEEATINKITEEVRSLLKAEFQLADTHVQKDKLAEELIKLADGTKDDLPGKYVLFKEALDLAVSTNNLNLGLTIIKQIDNAFIIDRHDVSITFLGELAKSTLDEQDVQEIVALCLAAQRELIGQDEQMVRHIPQYQDVAMSVLEPGQQEEEITRVRERTTSALTLAKVFLDLKADPDNGKANQLYGLHLLASGNKLTDAIPHLLKSDNKLFRHAAKLEQQKPASFDAEIELAEAWLKTKNLHTILRAKWWLLQANRRLPEFSGLTLLRKKALLTDLTKRIREVFRATRLATPDDTIRTIVTGLNEYNTAVLWEALPPSYQRRVNDAVRNFANSVDEKLWHEQVEVLKKLIALYRLKREFVMGTLPLLSIMRASGEVDFDKDAVAYLRKHSPNMLDIVFGLAETVLVESELGNLKKFKQFDGGRFLAKTGPTCLKQIIALLEPLFGLKQSNLWTEMVQGWESIREEKWTIEIDSDTNVAVVRFSEGSELSLKRIEGYWIPTEVVDLFDEWKLAEFPPLAVPWRSTKGDNDPRRHALSEVTKAIARVRKTTTQDNFNKELSVGDLPTTLENMFPVSPDSLLGSIESYFKTLEKAASDR
ncbi:MAG TPA: hypothetical protein EYN70_01465 [Planctomycetaceae bacterium]|nr:hypothetical protein [Planctomycetaceae bacterium]